MNKSEIKNLMENYNFEINTVKSFCNIYNLSESFVHKHLKLWNIKKKNKIRNVEYIKNSQGKFCKLEDKKLVNNINILDKISCIQEKININFNSNNYKKNIKINIEEEWNKI